MREMKDSGIEWIGAIPQDWKTDRLQWHLKEINVSNNPIQTKNILSLTIEAGVIPYAEKGNQGNKAKEDYSQYKIALPDTLVINSMNVIIGAVGISQYFGCVSPVYYVFEPIEGTDLRYIYYLFTNTGFQKEMRKYAKGILEIRLRISSNDMLKRIVPSPPFKEQQRIADYLDKMCAEIDAVLEKTRASIEEYKKLKQAVITQAVTKGIRGDRPMKNSGSVWFEEIPCNWVMKRIKYLFHIKKDIAGKEGYTVLSITQSGIKPKDLSKNEGQLADNYSHYQLLNPGDFAMNHMDLLTGWVDISKYSGVTSPDYRVFVLDDTEKNDSSYYLYLMQMCYFNRIFYGLGQGVSGMGRWRLQADKFMNFPVVVPPVDEQKEIVSYLNEKCKQLDTLIRNKQQYLIEIENYKKSLIYEYVTGKKEVV
jgi:type I restriction enzyme S subunit